MQHCHISYTRLTLTHSRLECITTSIGFCARVKKWDPTMKNLLSGEKRDDGCECECERERERDERSR